MDIKIKICEALAVTFYWIIVLTPFMLLPQVWCPLLFVGMNWDQFIAWLVIEFVIVIPFSLGSVRVGNKVRRKMEQPDLIVDFSSLIE